MARWLDVGRCKVWAGGSCWHYKKCDNQDLVGLVTATLTTVLTLPGMRMPVFTASQGLAAPAKVNIGGDAPRLGMTD